jgi:magnesium chelatase family protein
MDLLVSVGRPSERDLRAAPVTDSDSARGRVADAREWQRRRLSGLAAGCNGEMDARLVRRCVHLDDGAERALAQAYAAGALSARGRHRVLRVARTIADLEHHARVTQGDLLTALSLRQRATTDSVLAA